MKDGFGNYQTGLKDAGQTLPSASTSGDGSVPAGTGAPSTAPSGGAGFYIQTDSTPPGVIWEYYGGAWH